MRREGGRTGRRCRSSSRSPFAPLPVRSLPHRQAGRLGTAPLPPRCLPHPGCRSAWGGAASRVRDALPRGAGEGEAGRGSAAFSPSLLPSLPLGLPRPSPRPSAGPSAQPPQYDVVLAAAAGRGAAAAAAGAVAEAAAGPGAAGDLKAVRGVRVSARARARPRGGGRGAAAASAAPAPLSSAFPRPPPSPLHLQGRGCYMKVRRAGGRATPSPPAKPSSPPCRCGSGARLLQPRALRDGGGAAAAELQPESWHRCAF